MMIWKTFFFQKKTHGFQSVTNFIEFLKFLLNQNGPAKMVQAIKHCVHLISSTLQKIELITNG